MPKLIALIAALVLTGALAATALAATKRVRVGDNWFVRDTSGTPKVTVAKGTVVKWVWRGSRPHNVRVVRGPVRFSSPIKTSGSFRKKMRRRGTYKLVCDVHGGGDQAMKLVVR